MTKELIMNVTIGETRIARLENSSLVDLYIERDSEERVVGNIYKGTVNRVLPGMQAAFLDIGLEKAAFLYVSDVVSDLFEGKDDDDETDDYQKSDDNNDDSKDHRRSKRRRHRRGPLPKIEDLLKEGQTIVVQVAKEPIRTKGARVTCHLSFPGRYVVYMPTVDHIGVSRRVGSYEERDRLRKIIEDNKSTKGGIIARTASFGASDEALINDIKNLEEIWKGIAAKQEKAKSPSCLYQDHDLVLRSVRDHFTSDIDRLVIDSKEDYQEVMTFIEKFMPDMASRVELYNRDVPLFDTYGLETEINRGLGKKVWLKSGGYLIIDQNEALTAIDINTGRFVGRDDFEDTILQTNLEAAEEIAYQLRLRNIGGIIIIDFIDMERYSNRQKIFYKLKEALRKDRVRTSITKISELGLVEMTRKRTRDSLTQMVSESCFYCQGKGHNKSPLTVAFEMFREIRRTYDKLEGRTIIVKVHPRVARVLFNEARSRLDRMEKRIQKRVTVEAIETFHIEHFEIMTRS